MYTGRSCQRPLPRAEPSFRHPQAYRTVTVQLMNEDHTSVVQEWKLLRARPVTHVSGPFNARCNDVAMEELTLAYERLEME